MIEIAKEKDNHGRYAYLGMCAEVGMYLEINELSEAIQYIVDTYLECIDDETLIEYVESSCNVYRDEDLEDLKFFGGLGKISEAIKDIYGVETFIDEESGILYTTEKESTEIMNNRRRLNYIGIIQEAERLATLYENGIVKMSDAEVSLEIFEQYGFDMEEIYDIREDVTGKTVVNILDKLNEIFCLW